MGYFLTELAKPAICPSCARAIMTEAARVYHESYGVTPAHVDLSAGLKQVLACGSEGNELYTFEELGFPDVC